MSYYMNQIVYEEYAQEHHNHMMQVAATERSILNRNGTERSNRSEEQPKPVFRYKMAYLVAIVFLSTLFITRVVVAAMNASGGGGSYLLK